jgi:hypothetical protein
MIDVKGNGIYQIVWDGRRMDGVVASSGNYFYLVEIGDVILSGKMTMLK